ncbi:MAG TPA: TIGR03435 family protein [Terracidiphilus sp.]|nr:TIGR03435 family protein [Terracidiphilus sp.]
MLMAAGCMAWAGAHAQTNPAFGDSAPQAQNRQMDVNGTQQPLPQFEVAAIKPHKQEGMQMRAGFRLTPDGVSMFGVPLSMLMSQAFGLPESRILNEPEWANSDRYDIEAKVAPSEAPKLEKLTQQQRMAMLVPLLQDRFGLKFHHETKVREVYALVVDKGGPKLQPAEPDAAHAKPDSDGKPDNISPSANGNAAFGRPDGGGKPGDGGGPTKPPQGALMMRMSTEGMTIRGVGVTTAQLAGIIGRSLGSTVVDKTGLTGKYNYTLNFAPEMGKGGMGGMPPPPPSSEGPASGASSSEDAAASTPAAAPSIFTAVREQLGLKLQAKKEPVDVVVIDHIQQPSPN